MARCNAPPPDDQYLQLNQWRFDHEFSSWRSGGQSQYDSLQKIDEHMQVFGLVGAKFDAVNKVRGNRIILTLGDAQAGGHHYAIPSSWIQPIEDKTCDQVRRAWRNAPYGSTTTPEACRA